MGRPKRNSEYAQEIVTNMGSRERMAASWAEMMAVIVYQFDYAKAHPNLRRLGLAAWRLNVEQGLSDEYDE